MKSKLNKKLTFRVTLVFFITFSMINNVKAGIHQKRLLENLFKNYDAFERPVEHEDDTVNVSMTLSVQQIVDVVSFKKF